MVITWQSVIAVAGIISAGIAIYKYFAGVVRWVDKQTIQDAQIKAIQKEMALIDFGLLACLKGLAEQGCDGPVHDAIQKIEKHMNLKAHMLDET